MKVGYVAALALAGSLMMRSLAWAHSSTLSIRPAFVPVANSADRNADPAAFRVASPNVMLHEFILLPGWVKKAEFEALCQWLVAQGFLIVRANGPVPWQTYPEVKFNGTVAQFNQAFHVTVMEKLPGFPRCRTVFTELMMPARFATKGETYIQGYSFGSEPGGGLGGYCR
jgi:hypothetical protein